MTAIALAIAAAGAIGSADFFAGIVGRRDRTGAGLTPAYSFALVVSAPLALAVEGGPEGAQLGWGALMGVLWASGVFALSLGVAEGRVVVVVPTAGVLSAAVPVIVGVIAGERPSGFAWLGIAIGLTALALTGLGPTAGGTRTTAWSAAMGAVGGITTGFGLVALNQATGAWPMAAASTSAGVAVAIALAVRRMPLLPKRPAVLPAIGMGACVLASFWALVAGFDRGSLTTVAVIASQYPAVTILLVAAIWKQRPRGIQYLGVALALSAVAFIAAG